MLKKGAENSKVNLEIFKLNLNFRAIFESVCMEFSTVNLFLKAREIQNSILESNLNLNFRIIFRNAKRDIQNKENLRLCAFDKLHLKILIFRSQKVLIQR